MNRVEQMKALQKEALELFTKKNADYGDSFAKYWSFDENRRQITTSNVYNQKWSKYNK